MPPIEFSRNQLANQSFNWLALRRKPLGPLNFRTIAPRLIFLAPGIRNSPAISARISSSRSSSPSPGWPRQTVVALGRLRNLCKALRNVSDGCFRCGRPPISGNYAVRCRTQRSARALSRLIIFAIIGCCKPSALVLAPIFANAAGNSRAMATHVSST